MDQDLLEVVNSWFLVRGNYCTFWTQSKTAYIDGFPIHRPQVHGASWEEQSVPHLVLHWQTHRFLDDRLLQPPGGVFWDISGLLFRDLGVNFEALYSVIVGMFRASWRPWGKRLLELIVAGQSYGLGAWTTPQNHCLRFQFFFQSWVK